jgi:hypothetical protein
MRIENQHESQESFLRIGRIKKEKTVMKNRKSAANRDRAFKMNVLMMMKMMMKMMRYIDR